MKPRQSNTNTGQADFAQPVGIDIIFFRLFANCPKCSFIYISHKQASVFLIHFISFPYCIYNYIRNTIRFLYLIHLIHLIYPELTHNKHFIRHNIPKLFLYPGRLSLTQSAPYPICGFGHSFSAGICLAPRIRYAFIFSPYRYRSFPFTIPHCIRSAAPPLTNGVAIDVPLRTVYPPPGAQDVISTPGAARSGFT